MERENEKLRSNPEIGTPKFKVYGLRNFSKIPQIDRLSADQQFAIQVVAQVLPFRVSQYVVDQLIDWDNFAEDPLFRLVFPQREMLAEEDFQHVAQLLKSEAPAEELQAAVYRIRESLNPHPQSQVELNTPKIDGEIVEGMQHKYAETLLYFPAQGQTCHSYCTFCFRWPQFVGDKSLQIAAPDIQPLHDYLVRHKEVSDLLVTGGDSMVMSTKHLRNILLPMLEPRFDHVQNLRLGTKALSFWPYRFVTDRDADQLLRTFEELVNAGKHVAVMAHLEHVNELQTEIVQEAIRRIQNTGAIIRTQAPVLRNINDSAESWSKLWSTQVKLGIVPYYMFVERNTGAKRYFELPLIEAYEIYQKAIQNLSGLNRTVRGPVMSSQKGKVEISGICEIGDQKVFCLKYLQARNADWSYRPFFAKYDETATWFDQLRPAFAKDAEYFVNQQ